MYGFLQLVQVIVYKFIQLIQPLLVPICFVVAWMVVLMGLWSLWAAVRDSVQRARRMHQIPCSECRYFSGNYLLKCPVHPHDALSEAAIGCRDFKPLGLGWQLTRSLERDA